MRRISLALLLGSLVVLPFAACDGGGTTNPDEVEGDELGDGKLGQGPGGAAGLLGAEKDPAIVESESLIAEGKAEQGLARIDQALADQPDNARYHYVRANALSHLDRDAEARAAYEKAIELAPNDPLSHAALGNLLAFADGASEADKRAAIEHFQTALKIDPEFAAGHQALGTVLLELGDSQRAIEALDNADRIARTVETAYLLAQAYGKVGNAKKALEYAKAAVDEEPQASGVDLRLLYARLLMEDGQGDAAAKEFELAAKLVPDAPPLRLEVVRGLLELGKPDAAMIHMQWLVEHAGDELPVIVNHGRVLAALGKTDEALKQFDAALAKNPKLPAAHVYKIEALAQASRCKPAKKALAELEKLGDAKASEKAKGYVDACK